jgi:hypothetical protein
MREPVFNSLGEHPLEKRFLLEALADGAAVAPAPWIESSQTAALDWNVVLALAAGHSMVPPLYHFTCESGFAAVPHPVRSWLTEQYRCNALSGLRMARELVSIVGRLESAGVPAIAIKGPALAVSAYGALSRRRFVDLDLLVARSDRERAREVLIAAGYRPDLSCDGTMAPDFIVSKEGGEEFAGPRGGAVDLHTHLSSRYFPLEIEFASLLQRSIRVGIDGGSVRSLSPEDHLLLLCVHACKHGWAKLGYLCDIVRLIRSHPALDWDATMRRGADAGVRRSLLLGLYLAHIIAAAPVPDALTDAARADRRMPRLLRDALDGLWNVDDSFGRRLHGAIVLLASMDTAVRAARAAAVRVLVPSSDDWRAFPRIPRALHPLYYALRPFRLLASCARRAPASGQPERIFLLADLPRDSAASR